MAASQKDGMAGGRRRGERRKRHGAIPFADRRQGTRRCEELARSEPRAS